jgi:hypothetical protein
MITAACGDDTDKSADGHNHSHHGHDHTHEPAAVPADRTVAVRGKAVRFDPGTIVPAVVDVDRVRPAAAAGPAMLTGASHADGFAVVPPALDVRPSERVGWLALPPRD